MIDVVVIATDGSAGVDRAETATLDLADRFDAAVYGLYVVDVDEVEAAPEAVREAYHDALRARGERAIAALEERADREVTTAVLEGRPAPEIASYARDVDADVVGLGTRGRHGENRYLLGSVAARVVRTCPVPVLTVRQLAADEAPEPGAVA